MRRIPRSPPGRSVAAAALALLPGLPGLQAVDAVPAVGAPAPEFSIPDQDGRIVTRDSLLGKRVVLAFYPKDFTGG